MLSDACDNVNTVRCYCSSVNRFEWENQALGVPESFRYYRDLNYVDDEALFPRRLTQEQRILHRLLRKQFPIETVDGRTKCLDWSRQLMS
jgi:hypothetical protein